MNTRHDRSDDRPPILSRKGYDEASVFTPEALLREARRQKGLATGDVPEICILDPDGDIVEHLTATGSASRHPSWACYHTHLHTFDRGSVRYGVVGSAVGASFAVLVAEQLFASGCQLLISMTSAGQTLPVREPPYFIVIDRALRDGEPAIIICHPAISAPATPAWSRWRATPWRGLPFPLKSAPHGRPTRRFAKLRQRSQRPAKPGCWRSRWRPPRSMLSRRRDGDRLSVWPTSPTRWARSKASLEKGAANGAVASLGVIESIARSWLGRRPP